MMAATQSLGSRVGVQPACSALGVARATYSRRLRPVFGPRRRRNPPLKLSVSEANAVLKVMRSPRFMDRSLGQIWITLLDKEMAMPNDEHNPSPPGIHLRDVYWLLGLG